MNFKKRRVSLGLTQEALAKMMGSERSTISMWETGKSHPRAGLLPKLARIFGCTVDELLNDSPAEKGA